jgi:hypothetical protein
MFDFDEWAASLEIVGDEAYLPGERPTKSEMTPEARARRRANWRRWRDRNRDKWNAYKTEWTRRKRAA